MNNTYEQGIVDAVQRFVDTVAEIETEGFGRVDLIELAARELLSRMDANEMTEHFRATLQRVLQGD